MGRLSLSLVLGRGSNGTGLLSRFDPASHNGVLIRDDGAPEVWVHKRTFPRRGTLTVGQRVRFLAVITRGRRIVVKAPESRT